LSKPTNRAPSPAAAAAADEDDLELPAEQGLPADPTSLSIDELLTDLAGSSDAVVNVYRLRKTAERGQSAYEYVAKYPVEMFTLDQLRDDHDGGDFRLFINRGRDVIRRMRVSVAMKKAAPPGAAVAPVVGGAAPGLEALAAAMREGFAMMVRELAAVRAAPAVDVPALITAAGNMVQTLSAARPQAPPVAAPPPDPVSRLEGMLTLFQKGVELGREANSPEDPGIFGMIRELLHSPLTEAAVREITARQSAPLAAPPAPAPGVTVPPLAAVPPAPPRQANGGHAMNPWGFYIGQLVEKASVGADPSLYADLILDNVKPHELREKVDRPDWFEWICSLQPNAIHYRGWFDALHAELSLGLAERLAATNVDSRGQAADGQAPDDTT
jgi:hypothetical protein